MSALLYCDISNDIYLQAGTNEQNDGTYWFETETVIKSGEWKSKTQHCELFTFLFLFDMLLVLCFNICELRDENI